MRIYILALDEVFDTGLSTVLDTFSIANDLAESAGTPSIHFEITVVGVRPHGTHQSGTVSAAGIGGTACASGYCTDSCAWDKNARDAASGA